MLGSAISQWLSSFNQCVNHFLRSAMFHCSTNSLLDMDQHCMVQRAICSNTSQGQLNTVPLIVLKTFLATSHLQSFMASSSGAIS